jgi:hypothetical protein
MQMLTPFGPRIGKLKLPDDILKTLIQVTDDVLNDEYRLNIRHKLAGEIKEQNVIPHTALVETKLLPFFLESALLYIDTIIQPMFPKDKNFPKADVKMAMCWVNSMYKHEWNPPHIHNLDLSSIIVLKIPEKLTPPEGTVSFTNSSNRLPLELEQGTVGFFPEAGDFYLFPARLHHTVNPFSCEGERRTVSFNIKKTFDKSFN